METGALQGVLPARETYTSPSETRPQAQTDPRSRYCSSVPRAMHRGLTVVPQSCKAPSRNAQHSGPSHCCASPPRQGTETRPGHHHIWHSPSKLKVVHVQGRLPRWQEQMQALLSSQRLAQGRERHHKVHGRAQSCREGQRGGNRAREGKTAHWEEGKHVSQVLTNCPETPSYFNSPQSQEE